MNLIENKTFDEERALYGSKELLIKSCSFDGPADGESAFKECRDITIRDCFFNLRYPFWHNESLNIDNSVMTEHCRAALWYSENINITESKLLGIKALRECKNAKIKNCEIISPEFGWFSEEIDMSDCTAESEYFMLSSEKLNFHKIKLNGKYSFQYIKNSFFENCDFKTKDAFWHAKDTTIRNCIIYGEYLAWYSENLTFENCKIIGTQPFCYCKSLKLINCEMTDTDLCFERSEVEANVTTPIISVKNPLCGYICAPKIDKIIMDIKEAKGKIIICDKEKTKSEEITAKI